MQSIYEVTLNGTSFANRAAPGDGFFDPKGNYNYMDEGTPPSDVAKATAKSRAQRRFKNLVMQVHNMTNAYLDTQTVTGGDANTPPSQIVLRFVIEHGDASLVTDDENNVGQRLTGIAALKRCIARAYMIDESRNLEIWDTTATSYVQNGTTKAGVRGIVSNIAQVGPLADNLAAAEAAISITKIS